MRKILVVGLMGLTVLSVRRVRASSDDDNLRPDVLACEEAVKKLVECCDGFDPKAVTCTYYEHETVHCDYTETASESPTYAEDESACIIALDCAKLRDSGVCRRARSAVAPSSHRFSSPDFCGDWAKDGSDGRSTPTTSGPVCP